MGLFDTVTHGKKRWQTKWRSLDGAVDLYEECCLNNHPVGSAAPVPDGLYWGILEKGGQDGVVVVLGKKVVGVIPWNGGDRSVFP